MRTQRVLREAHIAARSLSESELTAIFKSMLTITDLGMLITDLEHRSLACNSKFGEIFGVESEAVPNMGVEELRGYVYPRLADREAWRSHLDEAYADPRQRLQDDLVLVNPFQVLHRTTGPVVDQVGQIVGRIWTFEDRTAEAIRQRRREAIVEASTFHDPDPSKVCRYVVERVAEEYDSTAILSIRDEDRMIFREIANAPVGMEDVRENSLPESYCRLALEKIGPVVVQDAAQTAEFCEILPARLGFRRCLTVPICNMSGLPIGTLCFMDSRIEEALTPDDIEFISVLANRLSTELERERLYEERTASQSRQLHRQSLELSWTVGVLEAMKDAFHLVGADLSSEELRSLQVERLRGVLDYPTAAMITVESSGATGFIATKLDARTRNVQIAPNAFTRSISSRPSGSWSALPVAEAGLDELISERNCVCALLPVNGESTLLLLARDEVSALNERYLSALLNALADQAALVLNSHRLRLGLTSASAELRQVERQLVQTEKLSVAGTLAASVAHDIRNIMASMSLICAQRSLPPEEKLAQVQTQIDRFTVLSHRLLSYVRPKSLQRQTVDLNHTIRQAVELLSAQARISGVRIELVLDRTRLVEADADRAEHLLVNLMMNAMQAMRTSGGVLRIRSGDEGIAIEDNGRGVPPHMLERIFEPFVSSRSDGFGLGLYSCRQIANDHGWELSVESTLEKGTLFTIDIP